MSFTPEQIEEVNVLFRRFAALEESLPIQLERISESLTSIETRFDQFQVTSHEQLVQETNNVMVQAQEAVNSLRTELHHYITRFHEHLESETPHPQAPHAQQAQQAQQAQASSSAPQGNQAEVAASTPAFKVKHPQSFFR
jgi:uncharacterized coiled-coil protein SlyX